MVKKCYSKSEPNLMC